MRLGKPDKTLFQKLQSEARRLENSFSCGTDRFAPYMFADNNVEKNMRKEQTLFFHVKWLCTTNMTKKPRNILSGDAKIMQNKKF